MIGETDRSIRGAVHAPVLRLETGPARTFSFLCNFLCDGGFRGRHARQDGETEAEHEKSCALHRPPPLLPLEFGTVSQEYFTSSMRFNVRIARSTGASAAAGNESERSIDGRVPEEAPSGVEPE